MTQILGWSACAFQLYNRIALVRPGLINLGEGNAPGGEEANRRADLQRVRPVSGDPWAPGAIGNAEWTGFSLAAVLRAAGAEMDPALHVAFQGADECHLDGKSFRYGTSIPMRKAMAEGVLLAYAMNGERLEAEHGAPLRVVVPGFAGVRSPKWLQTVTVQDQPSDSAAASCGRSLRLPLSTSSNSAVTTPPSRPRSPSATAVEQHGTPGRRWGSDFSAV